jgi:hypothetical protein
MTTLKLELNFRRGEMRSAFMRRNGSGLAVAGTLAAWFGLLGISGLMPNEQPARSLAGLAGPARPHSSMAAMAAALPSPGRWLKVDGKWHFATDGRVIADNAGELHRPLPDQMADATITGSIAAPEPSGRWIKRDGRWCYVSGSAAEEGLPLRRPLMRRASDATITGRLAAAETIGRWIRRDGRWHYVSGRAAEAATPMAPQATAGSEMRWQKIDGQWVFAALRADMMTTGSLERGAAAPAARSDAASGAADSLQPGTIATRRWQKIGGEWVFATIDAAPAATGRNELRPGNALTSPAAGNTRRDIAAGRWQKIDGRWTWRQQLAEDVEIAPAPAAPTAASRERREMLTYL